MFPYSYPKYGDIFGRIFQFDYAEKKNSFYCCANVIACFGRHIIFFSACLRCPSQSCHTHSRHPNPIDLIENYMYGFRCLRIINKTRFNISVDNKNCHNVNLHTDSLALQKSKHPTFIICIRLIISCEYGRHLKFN